MMDILNFEFMRNALMAGLLASLICGIIGTLVVVNRIVFISGGIAHASYGGVGLAFFFGLPVLPVTTGFTLCAALLMALVTLRARERADTVIGVTWAAGMALGVILLDLSPGYNVDLMSYLFGSILAVPRSDLWIMAGLACLVTGLVLAFYRGFLVMSFDEEFARSRGVPVDMLYCLLISMVGLSVVMIIRVVGLILVIALLTIPPFIAERRTRSLGAMMVLSALLSALFTVVGLAVSYLADITSGASIIAVASVGFFLSFLLPQKRS
ncbi:MAG: metal ABC transporter permease [Pseudodesulfovibrio sp.]|nr:MULTISPECIES: metal ABC transporter permease [Pseudodesulfovibrio]MBU4192989.1 metal ABC transporter permease [Pseudomonadota bacterium]MCG2732781.1 metal ABC transporter permease [Pseudodesulfovibrio aespoeensis]MBU4244950.1 metal ABC transporter permease [Pseudomonadota bacterium]MBU4378060.1 metal ABC transporter permease [Pseudomonadota bacterium]MBU4475553.1 metal ABC transporter permease [Pseudomonadota bacterium]